MRRSELFAVVLLAVLALLLALAIWIARGVEGPAELRKGYSSFGGQVEVFVRHDPGLGKYVVSSEYLESSMACVVRYSFSKDAKMMFKLELKYNLVVDCIVESSLGREIMSVASRGISESLREPLFVECAAAGGSLAVTVPRNDRIAFAVAISAWLVTCLGCLLLWISARGALSQRK